MVENEDRNPVTIIGLGPMGQALATAFLKNGHPTTLWNRSTGKADDLVRQGAVLADMIADAITASPLVIICVLDYNAVQSILEPVGDVLRGRVLVNLTTGSPEQSRRTAAWAAEFGIDYLDGVIMTLPTTIGTSASAFLYSGPELVYEAVHPSLMSLDGNATYLGADPGRAAAHDMALLDFLWASMSGYVHALALAGAENIAAREFAVYAREFVANIPDIMTQIANQVDEGSYPGDLSNIISAEAGMGHIIHASEHHGIDVSFLSSVRTFAQQAIDKGYGTDSFARVTTLLRKPQA
ncbi:dehydrogenase [Paenibacillus agaridevorans]|uniref:Dehydrogenase n=1 Tax=Paenibacillus agaridevorans TaxID=171404 RepID=A0A2R5EVL4_9BACL|nr:dehydrogenase [Paenibacillus agaridevorans]